VKEEIEFWIQEDVDTEDDISYGEPYSDHVYKSVEDLYQSLVKNYSEPVEDVIIDGKKVGWAFKDTVDGEDGPFEVTRSIILHKKQPKVTTEYFYLEVK